MAINYDRAQAGGRPQQPGGSKGGVQKMGGASGLADVLCVILEKGIVVDAWVRLSIIGIEILTLEIRAVIASVDTYLRYAEAIGLTTLAAAPRSVEPISIPSVPGINGNGNGNGYGNGRLPALPDGGGPGDEEILVYLDAHPEGVRLIELQAYFGTNRPKLESILNRLMQEGLAVQDAQRALYHPSSILTPATP
jgi:gas vesicle structural protein